MLKIYKIISLLFVTGFFVIHDVMYLEPIQEVREFNVIIELAFAVMAAVLFMSIDSLNGKRFYPFLNIGFFLIFISMLVDGLDQFYLHDEVYTAIWEKLMLFVGFLLVFLGVKGWIKDHASLNVKLEKQADTDVLTGLYNRRGLLKQFELMSDTAAKTHQSLSFIIADLDNFKRYNDKMGHIEGDRYLSHLGDTLYTMTNKNQVIGRWGGEEFAICMLGYDLNEAAEFAESIRNKVLQMTLPQAMQDQVITMSLGVSQKLPDEPFMQALTRADRFLYAAKNQGKNQTVSKG